MSKPFSIFWQGIIPAKFWQTMSLDEFSKFVEEDGWLNEEQSLRLWRMQDRNDTPPKRIRVQLRREDVERAFPKASKARGDKA